MEGPKLGQGRRNLASFDREAAEATRVWELAVYQDLLCSFVINHSAHQNHNVGTSKALEGAHELNQWF